MFYILTIRSLPFAGFCALMCALLGPTMSSWLNVVGVPALTFPFCMCALPFYLLQGSMKKIIAVSLATASVPEEHCRRYFLTVFVATTFRMFVGNLDPRSRELISASVRLEMQAYKKALSSRSATKVCVSLKRCEFLSNGVCFSQTYSP